MSTPCVVTRYECKWEPDFNYFHHIFHMHAISTLFAIVIIALVLIAQHDAFGASLYDEERTYKRRDEDAVSFADEESTLLDLATDDEVDQIKNDIPDCVLLSDNTFGKILEKYFAANPSVAGLRWSSADFMRRVQ